MGVWYVVCRDSPSRTKLLGSSLFTRFNVPRGWPLLAARCMDKPSAEALAKSTNAQGITVVLCRKLPADWGSDERAEIWHPREETPGGTDEKRPA